MTRLQMLEEMEQKLMAVLRQLNQENSRLALTRPDGNLSNRDLWKIEVVALLSAISELKQEYSAPTFVPLVA